MPKGLSVFMYKPPSNSVILQIVAKLAFSKEPKMDYFLSSALTIAM